MFKRIILLLVPILLSSFESNAFKMLRVCHSGDMVTVQWKPAKDTCSEFISYKIYWREGKGNNFQVIDSYGDADVVEHTYTPADLDNLENWEYFIKAESNCAVDGEIFSDTVKIDKKRPGLINLDSISVKEGKIVMGWSEHEEKSIKGYNIYYVDGGQTRKIDTVLGRKNTFYIEDSVGNPKSKSENYRIGAYDSCGNESAISIGVHNTIFLQYDKDSCTGKVELNWTGYKGWDVDSFAIIGAIDSGEFEVYKSADSGVLDIILDTLSKGKNYTFFIRAYKAGAGKYSSSSNKISFVKRTVGDPGYVYLRNVSVVDSAIEGDWVIEEPEGVSKYRILKGKNLNNLNEWKTINPGGTNHYSFRDENVEPWKQTYYYRVEVTGICEGLKKTSNYGKNIVLKVEDRRNSFNFSWKPYRQFNGNVGTYEIKKRVGKEEFSWETIGKTENSVIRFSKEKDMDSFPKSGICFRVEAIEDNENEYGFKDTSLSNVVCLYNDPIVHVPNAFVPSGVNDVFKPKGMFINYQASSMVIFDRWGSKVFETNNLENGWNGKYEGNGKLMPEGVYIYKINIVGKNKRKESIKGEVHLLK